MRPTNVRSLVGFYVGFFELPDMRQRRAINNFETNCQVCRVLTGVESPEESTGGYFASNPEAVGQLTRAGDR